MKPYRVLVVDDDSVVRELIKVSLKVHSVEVIEGTDGEEGLDKAVHEKPDLVLLDLIMPKIDGFEVCKKLRSNHTTRDIPVILLTSNHDEEVRQKSEKLGVLGYFTKPFSPKALTDRILALLK
jgi:two-component system alkaline phosphatase synthesis response regulator PhoP